MEKKSALAALSALAQTHRLDVFRYLVEIGPTGAPAGQISEALRLPNATLSFHLASLRQAGLVTYSRQGRSLVYRTEFGTMNDLIQYLTAHCCGGKPETCVGTEPALQPTSSEHRPHEAPR
ncbi:MAG: metalloregulator ArsR/SmtB family transcription factor [Pseudomonadota bacterium]|nr:metalloregulator ArsR/SmtB family transcription factor [Pseudomonadota bacterium]